MTMPEPPPARRKLYLDVDGVLLGRDPATGQPALAAHAREFLEFVLDRFDVFWLTTRCQGDVKAVLNDLRPYCDAPVMALLSRIRPTRFDVLKTEALEGDYMWLDDAPLVSELAELRRRGEEGRLIRVDTRRSPDDLNRMICVLT